MFVAMNVIAWIGLSQALFSGILVLTKGQKSISDKLLAAWLFLLAFEFLAVGIESEVYPKFIFLANTFLLFNPALYLYTCSLARPGFSPKWSHLFHLLPYLFFKVTSWVMKEPQLLDSFFENNSTLWYRIVFGICGIISWVVYLWLTGSILTRHRRQIRNEFSNINIFHRIGWIQFVVIFYILYSLSIFMWGLFNVILFSVDSITVYNYSVLLFMIYILGFYGLKQRDLFPRKGLAKIETVKLQNMFIDNVVAQKISNKLLQYFEKEKPYLNPDLNMTVLSEKLNIPKHHLTEVMNKNMGKNFFQFVNEYRVEAVKDKLSVPANPYSIEAIGYECGFNSKSTFFSVFKAMTGQTPGEFQKRK
jgi:AraC-like DNA-binding protein